MYTKCLNKIKVRFYSQGAIKHKAMEYCTMLQFSGFISKKKNKLWICTYAVCQDPKADETLSEDPHLF